MVWRRPGRVRTLHPGPFFVFAGFAESGTVDEARPATLTPGEYVVVVADRGVAVGRAAGDVARQEEAALDRCEEA